MSKNWKSLSAGLIAVSALSLASCERRAPATEPTPPVTAPSEDEENETTINIMPVEPIRLFPTREDLRRADEILRLLEQQRQEDRLKEQQLLEQRLKEEQQKSK